MKFNPFAWKEIKTNVEIQIGKGRLRLLTSAPVAVFVSAQGFESLAGYSAAFDLDLSETVAIRVEAPKGIRAFIADPLRSSSAFEGEVFTNVDRLPMESGSVAEVTKALRMLEISRRQSISDIRREMGALHAARNQASPPLAEPPAPAEPPAEPSTDV